ncbi:MAG TPA: PAS domain-containing protein [Fibrobacteria bacterium]|nr:PAS domain-containing protein [Fibrobacteria bacterium]
MDRSGAAWGGAGGDDTQALRARLAAAEERARAIEQELRPFIVLADNIPDHIYFKDREGRFIWVNRNMFRSRGFPSRESLIGRTSRDILAPERAADAMEDDGKILETGEYLLNKLERDETGDGRTVWFLTTKIPMRDVSGAIIGICGISKDITTQMNAEQVLARETALRNDLLENLPDSVYFKDIGSRFTWINRAFVEALGVRSKEDVLGKTDADFFNADHAAEAREDEVRIIRTRLPSVNKLDQDNYPDGSPRWVITTKIPLHDGKGRVVGTCGVTKDITALKKAEEALALESNLLRTLMENIPDAIYFKDRDSRFVRVSRNCHLEGMERPEDAIGKTDFDFFAKEHAQQSFDDEQQIIRTGVPLVDKVEKEVFSTGRPISWVSTTKVPIHDQDGRITGLVGISRDVTERAQAEEAVRKAKDELEVRVQERTSALVQEIKEHLKTEKALREGERKLQEANMRLESRVNQLDFLNAAAGRLTKHTHRRELLPSIVETFTQVHEGVEAALCEMGPSGYLCVAASLRIDTDELRKDVERSLGGHGQVHLTAPVLVADRKLDPDLSAIEFPGIPGHTAWLALPLLLEERPLAVVVLLAQPAFLEWYEQEQALMATLAAQVAVSLSNANNFEELAKQARLESELEVAQTIQRRFTPQGKPPIPRVNLMGVYHPAYEVGGDYLDYFQTDSGAWVVVIADVSGKGIPAALVMTMLRSTFRAEARYETSAKKLLCAVNDLMIDDLDDKSFVTALCLIIDKDGRSMSYARAGHPPLLLQKGSRGNQPVPLNPKGLALGMVGGKHFSDRMEEMTLDLADGDRFLIFTDGLLEAMDADREFYGIKRLLEILASDTASDPEKVLERILDDVRGFIRSEPYHDDLTMLAMEVAG